MKVEIIDSSTGKTDSIMLPRSATFHDVMKRFKKLNTTDAYTLTYAGQDIRNYGRDTITSQAQLFRDQVKFYVVTPTSEMRDAKEFTDMKPTPLLMCIIPLQTKKIVLDMSWGFAAIERDYMDAACMIFKENQCLATVDLDNKSWSHNGREVVSYSGRGMNDRNSRGFHNIDILVQHLPNMITHLFMTMSAWSNSDLSDNKYPLLRCYDSKNEKSDMCNTTTSSPPKSESIILSYMSRASDGWKLLKSGHICRGNAIDYEPAINKIKEIISSDEEASDDSASDLVSVPQMPMSIKRLPSTDGLNVAPVEIVFSFDTTGSMNNYLEEVKKCVHDTITELLEEIPTLRICVFAHGDYDTIDPYVTTYTDFSSDKEKLCQFVNSVKCTWGNDFSECYEFVLHEVRIKPSWLASSKKSLVMIGDATPHEKYEDKNRLGLDWRSEAEALVKEKGVRIYAIQANNISESEIFWKGIADIGHGKHLGLNNFPEIVKLLKMISKREGAIAF